MDIFYPTQLFANFITDSLFQLEGSYLGEALNFFIYDTIKIGLLLLIINYLMAVVRYYLPIEKIRDFLNSRKWYGLDYLLSALLGAITPFCSCSSIPLFIGFLSSGIPIGVTFTFLIASPLINETSLILFPSIFGLKTAIIYNIIGMVISILSGMLIQRLKLEKYVNQDLLKYKARSDNNLKCEKIPFKKLLNQFWVDGFAITKTVFPYVVLGVLIGSLIHGFVPSDVVEKYLSYKEYWAVPVATIMGIPLYTNSVSVIPIVEVLVSKGIRLGTALAFMTATVTLSIPEALILKKVMKWQLLAIFFAISTIGIMTIGFVFNLL